jgi:hypothetical protein
MYVNGDRLVKVEKMEEENIRNIAIFKEVKDVELFVKFLSKRFPDESDYIISYFLEWADRFNSGHPERYMDLESKRIYLTLKGGKYDVV